MVVPSMIKKMVVQSTIQYWWLSTYPPIYKTRYLLLEYWKNITTADCVFTTGTFIPVSWKLPQFVVPLRPTCHWTGDDKCVHRQFDVWSGGEFHRRIICHANGENIITSGLSPTAPRTYKAVMITSFYCWLEVGRMQCMLELSEKIATTIGLEYDPVVKVTTVSTTASPAHCSDNDFHHRFVRPLNSACYDLAVKTLIIVGSPYDLAVKSP